MVSRIVLYDQLSRGKPSKYYSIRISVPMSYIAFIHCQTMSRIQTIYCHNHKIIIIISAPFTTTIIIPGGGEKDELWAYIGRSPNSIISWLWQYMVWSIHFGHFLTMYKSNMTLGPTFFVCIKVVQYLRRMYFFWSG